MSCLLWIMRDFLTFVKSYAFLPLRIILAAAALAYNHSIISAARSDIRNHRADIVETFRLAKQISSERFSRRELPAMIYRIGFPSVVVLIILSLAYG
jgi:hypothetical protein